MKARFSSFIAAVKRIARFAKALYRDPRTPRWAKWALGALFVIPTPFELDEVGRVVVAAILWMRHRDLLRELWAASSSPQEVSA